MSEVGVETGCNTEQSQRICVVGKVSVTPTVECAAAEVACVGAVRFIQPHQTPCPDGTLSRDGTCRFTVAQELCVTVPVEFDASVECGQANAHCFPAVVPDAPAESLPFGSFLFTRSADFYREHLFPANFDDEVLCQATRSVRAHSSYLSSAIADVCNVSPCDPCPAIFPLGCLDRLEELLAPATDVFGRTARQLLAVLLNASLSVETPQGLVGGLGLTAAVTLAAFPKAAERLGGESTVGAVAAAANAALAAEDEAAAAALEPVLAALNTEGAPPILI